ncbi:MAG: DNA-directed RNA polymerase subunit beta [Planctomycetota bacterium]|jgi:DNA-directed RNA polymerase subunit beta|nr:DNA-directed RNA polymerase subunit beta [Planctomycetota bacterium]
MEIRNYGKVNEIVPVPDLVQLQTAAYLRFLQRDIDHEKREDRGLESILREVFPIENNDKSLKLEFLRYELGAPRYTPEECRRLRLTYGMPFKVWMRLDKQQPIEEEVYLGELPIMIGGGEFIINGAERVIVSQLHRSPGVDFSEEIHSSGKKLHSCRIIPERGSWVETNVTRKDVLTIRIDQSGKFASTCLLRAMSPDYSTDADIIRLFYPTKKVKVKPGVEETLQNAYTVEDIVRVDEEDPKKVDVLVEGGKQITERAAEAIVENELADEIEIIEEVQDQLILATIAEDASDSHENALLRIYRRLRPGNPPSLEKARQLFHERFYDMDRYRLGRVGRFRLNRKFDQAIPESEMTLTVDDLISCIRYIIALRRGNVPGYNIDDIDHLGNRRVRTIEELAQEELRKGFLKLQRTVEERMGLKDQEDMTPRTLINSRTVSAAIEYFFGRGELSQVVDQVNPLAQLTHERRLSALGPGGLNRKRAGFEVRDVHISHYGRICPIETPEGTNIGLIVSLSIYAGVDDYGFLTTPYRVVKNGKMTKDIEHLRADSEDQYRIAAADVKVDEKGRLSDDQVFVRYLGDMQLAAPDNVDFMDVSPRQMVGVSASLIPFLEHDDANRALMGSNMQRQAVPLLITDPPLVGTGMEEHVARNSSMVVRTDNNGTVKAVDARHVQVDDQIYDLRKFRGLNERTCLNQRPIVELGQKVKAGEVIADGPAVRDGVLSLGRNVLCAFMPFDGHNFEDAILISQRLVKEDMFTSLHVEEFEVEIRETKLGREEFTMDIPNVSEKSLRNLDDEGIVRIGTRVKPGEILVGKVSPKSKTELSPEEKLLHAIFGRAGEDVKNDSLEVPSGVDGVVIDTEKFSRKAHLTEEERKRDSDLVRKLERDYNSQISTLVRELIDAVAAVTGGKVLDLELGDLHNLLEEKNDKEIAKLWESLNPLNVKSDSSDAVEAAFSDYGKRINEIVQEKERRVYHIKRGDELPTGVLEMVKVYICTKRTLSVGDKMAGRHGNKGVIAKILPEEDMPFLEDGTPIQICLNPLGVPSRMNLGQILETHLGWAANKLGFRAVTPVFDGCSEEQIRDTLEEAGLPRTGKAILYDGRTGEPFDQDVTVGFMYMLKLDHLVDDKVHARATGPYSLITQQPLGGKARFGGQRFGEMEVWALEAYGAAHILQELLTVKSDDVEGRTKVYESMVKGTNVLEAGTPVSFDVLVNEIKGLALNIKLDKERAPGLVS